MKKVFVLEWDDSLGENWMNIDNLKLCLYTQGFTKEEIIKVRELIPAPVGDNSTSLES